VTALLLAAGRYHYDDSTPAIVYIVFALIALFVIYCAYVVVKVHAAGPGGVCPWCRQPLAKGAWVCGRCGRDKRPWMDWIAGPGNRPWK
jgi:hypothetical protein